MNKPMTMTQKILAQHAGSEYVESGDLITVNLDLVLGNEITTDMAIKEYDKLGLSKVFDIEKVVIVPDHFTPCKDINSAQQCKRVRKFAREKEIKNYFEVGEMGIEHVIIPEKGLVAPGDLVIGADSHTCTYGAMGAFSTGIGSTDMGVAMATGKAWLKVPEAIKFHLKGKFHPWVTGKDLILHIIGKFGVDGALYKSMEFVGEGVSDITMDERFTICNMGIEAGAKNAIFPVDDVTKEYLKGRLNKEMRIYEADSDAVYSEEYEINLEDIVPTVAFPHSPENTKTIDEAAGISIDQVVIGSCTNGRIEDLRLAAAILKSNQVKKGVRAIIIPGSQETYLQAIKEHLIEIFIEAGAVVSTPTCGPCIGGHMGALADGEKAVSTTNRNFLGRMGHVGSEVYLASPAVAAASAISGVIASPEAIMDKKKC